MLITPNEILISFENSVVFQVKPDVFHQICAEILQYGNNLFWLQFR